ncbi:MAG: exonuclease domain-containing protein [Blautia sp.]|nr:exonuclease domain-containing protein [Blautia sp.]
MNYIVFDLEWNQSPHGKRYSVPEIPFEIIEIGAIKLNERMEPLDTFQTLIRPKVYKWIHNSIHDVIHVNYQDLIEGTPFPQAIGEFIEWCRLGQKLDPEGYVVTDEEAPEQDFFFCTWGNQDVMELQRNMKYYDLLTLLPGPVTYYDVQKLFALAFETSEVCRSLEYAVDYLDIDKAHGFHRALEDAHFTAMTMLRLDPELIRENPALDTYQNPQSKKEELLLHRPRFTEYVSREFVSREKAVKDREVMSTRCPMCGSNAKRQVRWFSGNSKTYYSISQCQEHGAVTGILRFRKTENGGFFADKILKNATEEEANEIRDRRESLREKKKAPRHKKPKTAD